jgi:hypothetical protein
LQRFFCVGRFEERPRVRALCERVRTRERSCVRTRAGTRAHTRGDPDCLLVSLDYALLVARGRLPRSR